LSTVRKGKVQFPRLFSYCAAGVITFLVLLGMLSLNLPRAYGTILFILPLPLGTVLGIVFYYRFGHEVVQYDDTGFTVHRGAGSSKTYDWSQFTEVSLAADQRGGVNVRLYFQPDGQYVDIPASKTGVDPFSLRDMLLRKFSKS